MGCKTQPSSQDLQLKITVAAVKLSTEKDDGIKTRNNKEKQRLKMDRQLTTWQLICRWCSHTGNK